MLETSPVSDGPNVTEIAVFDAFAFLGLLLNAAVLVPVFFFSRVRRQTAWSGLIVSFFIYSLSFLAIVRWQTDSQMPPFGLCILQTALIYASPTLVGISYICFTVDFSLQLSTALFGQGRVESIARRTNILVILPWLCFFTVFVTVFLIVEDPSLIQPSVGRFYCHAMTTIPSTINVIAAVVVALIMFPLDLYMTYILHRHWMAFRRLSLGDSGISLSMYIRLTLFLLLGGIGIGLSAAFVPSIGHTDAPRAWNVLLPIIPVVGAFTFGTQRDIMQAWIFWRRKSVPPDPPSTLKLSPSETSLQKIEV